MDPNDRALVAFTMLGHAAFHSYELVIPIFVVVWLDAFDVSAAVMGAVVGAGYALVGLGAIPSGVLSDVYSSKRLIVGSMLGIGGGFLVLSVAPNLAVLAVGLLVWGAAASVYHPAGLSLVSRGAKARGTAFAYHGVAGNVGIAVGPLLAAVLLAFFGWRVVAALLVVPVAVAVAIATRLEFDETAAVDSGAVAGDGGAITPRELLATSKLLFTGAFVLVFLIATLYGLYYRGAFTFLPDILADLPLFEPATVGGRSFEPSQYVYSGLLMLGGAGQYVGGKLTDRVEVEYALVATFAGLVCVSLVFVAAADAGLLPLLVVCGLLGFLVFAGAPMNQALIAKHAPSDVHGLSYGYVYLANFGAGALGAVLAGLVLTGAGPAALFVGLAAVSATAGLVGVWLVYRTG